MSFNSDDLKKLKELVKKLPNELDKPLSKSECNLPESRQYKFETDDDPDNIFHSIIDASTDGSIPSHLIDRIKEAECKQSNSREASDISINQRKQSNHYRYKESASEEDSLYFKFKNLLLDEEED
ncbi:hypothetical protein [Prochlorococcus sp. MIT 1223]|uniref:hypothetical protein n=1 Tax=Prochlorococcus sp. MIT 1223 TaxID=3096217 RepID=UPI002A75C7F2|nr:hypothetical protein [Prochlorococcus sp. MIT 1223]